MLDEPFSAVDAFARMRLQDLLLNVAARHATPLLLVTHDIDEAVYLSDRIIVTAPKPGRLIGEIRNTAQRPRNRSDAGLSRLKGEVMALLDGGSPLDPRPFAPCDDDPFVIRFRVDI